MKIQRGMVLQFSRYLAIGLLVAGVDTGSFALGIRQHIALLLATTIAYILGVIAHFTLNRLLNFRNFDRQWHEQARTYGAIVTCQFLITLGIVGAGVGLGLQPIAAKIIAAATNVPVGFFAHRYLTFGPGIIASIRQYLLYRGRAAKRSSADDKVIEIV